MAQKVTVFRKKRMLGIKRIESCNFCVKLNFKMPLKRPRNKNKMWFKKNTE